MHDDPRHGVVDRGLQIHDSSSVYVAGGIGLSYRGLRPIPRLTIVALAIRLADELKATSPRGD